MVCRPTWYLCHTFFLPGSRYKLQYRRSTHRPSSTWYLEVNLLCMGLYRAQHEKINGWLCKWMYTFICTTAGSLFGFGTSSWLGGRFSLFLTMWEKISPFLSVFSHFFLPSPYVRKFFSISHSFSLWEKKFLAFSLSEKFFHMNRELCTDSMYMFLAFSLCEKTFLCFSQFFLYVRNFSPLLPMWENSSHLLPYERKNFSPSHSGEKKFLT